MASIIQSTPSTRGNPDGAGGSASGRSTSSGTSSRAWNADIQACRLLLILVFVGLSLFTYKYVHSGELSRFVLNTREGEFPDSLPLFKLRNSLGMEVHVSVLGGALLRVMVPDKAGKTADVVLGYETVEEYETATPVTYFGVVVGRVANRIANATFALNGTRYRVPANDGANSLHGGLRGLHKRVWEGQQVGDAEGEAVTLHYTSPDGEEGYPGTLHVRVTYRLPRNANELQTTITATTNAATPVNLAQHSYFNLGGHSSGSILNHRLRLHGADHYTPVSAALIPTGEILPVAGTPFDFTTQQPIGSRITQVPGAAPGGYDHNFVLFGLGAQARNLTKNGMASDEPKLAATLVDPTSGRCMDVLTTAPGVQFYSGNFLDGSTVGKGGVRYSKHAGLCLETQGFPNAINEPKFPSVLLQPKDTYRHKIVYRFYNTP